MAREWVYPPVIGGLRAVFALLHIHIRLDGADAVPASGPVILASNHVSYLDFAFVGLAARHSNRYARFLARYDVWNNPFAGPLMRGMHHIPVDREAPGGAYMAARAALRQGEAVAIFPEAGVSKSYTVRPIKPGAAALSMETGAPIVPVAVWGGQRIYTANPSLHGSQLHSPFGRPITILVGKPWHADNASTSTAETVKLGAILQALLTQAQRQHRDQPVPGQPAPWHPAALGGTAPTPAEAFAISEIPRGAIDWGGAEGTVGQP